MCKIHHFCICKIHSKIFFLSFILIHVKEYIFRKTKSGEYFPFCPIENSSRIANLIFRKIRCKSKQFLIKFCNPCKIVPPQECILEESSLYFLFVPRYPLLTVIRRVFHKIPPPIDKMTPKHTGIYWATLQRVKLKDFQVSMGNS